MSIYYQLSVTRKTQFSEFMIQLFTLRFNWTTFFCVKFFLTRVNVRFIPNISVLPITFIKTCTTFLIQSNQSTIHCKKKNYILRHKNEKYWEKKIIIFAASKSTGPTHGKVVMCSVYTEFTLASRNDPFKYNQSNLNLCTHLVARDSQLYQEGIEYFRYNNNYHKNCIFKRFNINL